MAKLNGVKTLDMVNGEITKVAYEGAEYAAINTFGESKEGDLLYSKNYDSHYVSEDSFYAIIGNTNGSVRFIDNYKENGFSVNATVVKAFRKISAQSNLTLEQRVETLESDVAALKSSDSSLKGEKESETIEFEGATYRKVEREAREGDVVTYASPAQSYVTKGKPYKVLSRNRGLRILDEDGDELRVYNEHSRTRETVDVYEPIEQAKYVPQEGDIVVITANTSSHANKIGDIGKVGKEEPLSDGGVKVYVPGGPSHTIRTKPCEVRKATPAEVEKYEQAVKDANKPKLKAGDFVKFTESRLGITPGKVYEVVTYEDGELVVVDDNGMHDCGMNNGKEYEILSAEEAKWAKIGRKPNEFKKGDVVRVLGTCNGHEIAGQLGEVVEPDGTDRPLVRAVCENELVSLYSRIELVAPVESLFNA